MGETGLGLFKRESAKKTFAKVFDQRTILALHALARKGFFDFVEFVVSTGKEAHVFRAQDHAGNFRAVKIYKTLTTDFTRMKDYLKGDLRFKHLGKNKRELVNQWTRKEFKNLEKFGKAGIRVPLPLAFRENVLVMEFIGKEKAAPTLKEKPPRDIAAFKETIEEWLALMVGKAGLVHADLSEYNILNFDEEPVLIDCAQSVLTSHPRAEYFFKRDLENIASYLSKNGLKTSPEALLKRVREIGGTH